MEQIFSNVSTFIQNAIDQAQMITPWLAAAGVVIFGLMYAFGGQQSAQFAKSRGVQMVVGLILVWGVAAVVNTLISLGEAGSNVSKISIGMSMMFDVLKVSIPKAASYIPLLA